ncbi:MAG TPA: SurA N-terminal domain-containing protein [Burkholderiaceae bacterium]|nr:SurA N-terminal domain-containing protein [Burkholderiaceae bacterium]
MFDFVRAHRNWMMLFILVLILPSFVFFGIQGYNSYVDKDGALATVGGAPVTQQEYDVALRERAERLRQAMGSSFDAKLLETPEARAAVLDQLVLDRALANEANQANVVVTVDRLRDFIANVPAFQEDGKFSYDRYKAFLASRGQSEAAFEQTLRNDLRKQAFLQAVVESAITPRSVIERIERILLEQREVRELRFPAEQFASKVSITEAQITEYYQGNRAQFEIPESVRVEYVVLSPETIAGNIKVADDAAKNYYDQNKTRYGTEEQRRASHILIPTEGSDKAAARKKAEEILAKVKSVPNDFAKLARENSKDPGSAAQGGDLGYFGRGMMVKPFEETAYRMKEGEISDVVETDFGFHIIRVTEIKPAQAKPFAEVRTDIERELRNQQAQKSFTEAADQFTNLVYEQADSLQPASQKLNLKIMTADNLTRRGLPPHLGPRVVEAVFAEDSLKNRRNTQAIEVAASTLVSARVLDYRPASVQPLDKVAPEIRQLLERREAIRLAREAGEQRLAALRKEPIDKANEAGFSAPKVVSRRQPQDMPADALNEVLRIPADKLPQFVGAEVATDFRNAVNAGYVIVKVIGSKPSETVPPAQRDAQARAINQQDAASAEITYADGLKARHDVKILRADLQRKTAEKPATKSAPADVKPGQAK